MYDRERLLTIAMNTLQKITMFLRKFWILLLILFVVFLTAFIVIKNGMNNKESLGKSGDSNTEKSEIEASKYQYRYVDKMSDKELAEAENAFSKGIKINDAKGDFLKFKEGDKQPEGLPDNPNPYPLDFTDLKSVSIGADQNKLYIKYEYRGIIPTSLPQDNSDHILSMEAKVSEFSFINSEGESDSAELQDTVMFVNNNDKTLTRSEYPPYDFPVLIHGFLKTPIGVDDLSEMTYKTSKNSDCGKMFGGPGYNYFESYWLLSDLGIKYGDQAEFSLGSETGSVIYHHENIDNILGEIDPKFGSKIRYIIGSNTYKDLGVNNGEMGK